MRARALEGFAGEMQLKRGRRQLQNWVTEINFANGCRFFYCPQGYLYEEFRITAIP